jgi:hypothetical protein
MSEKHTSTYLQDHLAGSTAAIELLENLEKNSLTGNDKLLIAKLLEEIQADRQELENLMQRWNVSTQTLRSAVAWLSEKALRVKLRLDDFKGDQLGLLESFEIVATGIHGKQSLWQALEAAAVDAERLRGPDYQRLIARAIDQRQRIEELRLKAARAALE